LVPPDGLGYFSLQNGILSQSGLEMQGRDGKKAEIRKDFCLSTKVVFVRQRSLFTKGCPESTIQSQLIQFGLQGKLISLSHIPTFWADGQNGHPPAFLYTRKSAAFLRRSG